MLANTDVSQNRLRNSSITISNHSQNSDKDNNLHHSNSKSTTKKNETATRPNKVSKLSQSLVINNSHFNSIDHIYSAQNMKPVEQEVTAVYRPNPSANRIRNSSEFKIHFQDHEMLQPDVNMKDIIQVPQKKINRTNNLSHSQATFHVPNMALQPLNKYSENYLMLI